MTYIKDQNLKVLWILGMKGCIKSFVGKDNSNGGKSTFEHNLTNQSIIVLKISLLKYY